MGKETRQAAGLFRRPSQHLHVPRVLDWVRHDASGNKRWSVGSLTIHMAIMRSMEKVTKVNVRAHVRMRVRRAALAVIAGVVVGCTAHSIPSTALAELPVARLAALALNSGGTLLHDASTDGRMLLFGGPNRAVRLANFDLSDPVQRDAARPRDLAAPIGAPAGIVRLRQSGSEYAVLRLPGVRAPKPLTRQIQPSRESPDGYYAIEEPSTNAAISRGRDTYGLLPSPRGFASLRLPAQSNAHAGRRATDSSVACRAGVASLLRASHAPQPPGWGRWRAPGDSLRPPPTSAHCAAVT